MFSLLHGLTHGNLQHLRLVTVAWFQLAQATAGPVEGRELQQPCKFSQGMYSPYILSPQPMDPVSG